MNTSTKQAFNKSWHCLHIHLSDLWITYFMSFPLFKPKPTPLAPQSKSLHMLLTFSYISLKKKEAARPGQHHLLNTNLPESLISFHTAHALSEAKFPHVLGILYVFTLLKSSVLNYLLSCWSLRTRSCLWNTHLELESLTAILFPAFSSLQNFHAVYLQFSSNTLHLSIYTLLRFSFRNY